MLVSSLICSVKPKVQSLVIWYPNQHLFAGTNTRIEPWNFCYNYNQDWNPEKKQLLNQVHSF